MREDEVLLATSERSDGNLSFAWGDEQTVIENRAKFLAKHGVRPGDCVVMQVEHGERIVTAGPDDVAGSDLRRVTSAEALITREKGVVLFLLTGDCLPIALYDPVQKVIALAHLGWKPTGHKLVQKVIAELSRQFATKPRDLIVSIGPGIHKESYHFTTLAQQTDADWAPYLTILPSGETAVDLVAYNKQQLMDAGVLEEHLTISPHDTAASPKYFSHYRSLRTGELEGRFATILTLR